MCVFKKHNLLVGMADICQGSSRVEKITHKLASEIMLFTKYC
jgi:hypothetical protein